MSEERPADAPTLLPVNVSTPTLLPSERSARMSRAVTESTGDMIVIDMQQLGK